MITDAEPMACGNCGHGSYRVFSIGGQPEVAGIYLECQKCRVVAALRPKVISLVLDTRYVEGSGGLPEGYGGRPCRMEPKTVDPHLSTLEALPEARR